MAVIVTRPHDEAQRWAGRLRTHGVAAEVLPLIEIAPAVDSKPVRAAWGRLASYRAAMFVSGNAVRHFFAAAPAGAVFPVRAWAPGPGTADVVRECGVAPDAIDEPAPGGQQFDSEALWQRVAGQVRAGDRVLLVRGGDAQGRPTGREWLAGQVIALGGACDSVVAYRRCCPRWTPEQSAAARAAAADGSLWLLSSSEAVANLRALLPHHDWGAAHALATHPRIAQAAREAGFGAVRECRPAFEEVLASLQSGR